MPITEELQNVKELESVGFPHEQAEALASVIEKSHRDSQESLKEFIRAENEKLRNELVGKIKDLEVSMKDLEVSMAVSQKDLLVKIFAIIVGTVGVAVTILKLF